MSSYLSITLSGSTIIPHMEVFDIDVVIRLSFPLTPKQQALFSGHFCNRNLTGVSSRRLWTAWHAVWKAGVTFTCLCECHNKVLDGVREARWRLWKAEKYETEDGERLLWREASCRLHTEHDMYFQRNMRQPLRIAYACVVTSLYILGRRINSFIDI